MKLRRSDQKCVAVIACAQKAGKFRGYPKFYTLEIPSGGLGLFAAEGKHRGAGMGHASPDELRLYGVDAFARWGGLAWQKFAQHTYYRPRRINTLSRVLQRGDQGEQVG